MSKSNFIPCVSWVKRGVTKEIPETIELTKEELKRVIEETKQNIDESLINNEENEDMNVEEDDDGDSNQSDDVIRRYNLDNYDDEEIEESAALGLGNLTVYAANDEDPYLDHDDSDDNDEKEDFKIKDTDNLILVGHVEKDAALLEVYVYNHDNDDLYVHHDIILPSYPICFEWINYDAKSESENVNYVAIGDMTKDIGIWDIDLVNSLEPVTKLIGHKDAVLDLSWNSLVRKTIASGSADHSVGLWDLESSKIVNRLSHFKSNVQSLKFHPYEAQTLLIGDCDGIISLSDCHSGAVKKWNILNCEIEKVLWNTHNPYTFFASSSHGFVYCFDCRFNEKYIYSIKAHSDSVTGLCLSPSCAGCLITASIDKSVKIWDIDDTKAKFITEFSNLNIGSILGMSINPDLPFTIVVGGDKRSDNMKVLDISTSKQVHSQFVSKLKHDTNSSQNSGHSNS